MKKLPLLFTAAAAMLAGHACGYDSPAMSKADLVIVDGVITNMTARARGGGSPFGGEARELRDLDDLVETAYGTGRLGLHRGHAPIEAVLSAFLGIDHEQMHVYMEDERLNLADTAKRLGLEPDKLVATLVESFMPYVREAVDNGVITEQDAPQWRGRLEDAFRKRVYWQG